MYLLFYDNHSNRFHRREISNCYFLRKKSKKKVRSTERGKGREKGKERGEAGCSRNDPENGREIEKVPIEYKCR